MYVAGVIVMREKTLLSSRFSRYLPRRMLVVQYLLAMGPSQRERQAGRSRGMDQARVIDGGRCAQQSQKATLVCSTRW
jgi:hypothetical protein